MKAAIIKRQFRRFVNYAPYPNAITPRQAVHKALDMLIMAASGAGIGAMLLLFLAM